MSFPSIDSLKPLNTDRGKFNSTIIHVVFSKETLESIYDLYRGSGGIFASTSALSPTGGKIQIERGNSKLIDAIQEVCSTFALTKDELACICRIKSRKTLYNWMSGNAIPRKSAVSRLFDLLITARAWRHSGFQCSKEELFIPILNGQKLFEILNQDKINQEHILFAGSRLNFLSSGKGTIKDPFV